MLRAIFLVLVAAESETIMIDLRVGNFFLDLRLVIEREQESEIEQESAREQERE